MPANLSHSHMQALMVAIGRVRDAYGMIQGVATPPRLPTDVPGEYSRERKRELDIRRILRSSLLASAYSMTETVLADCIGKSPLAANAALGEDEKRALLIKVEYNFRKTIGDAFGKTIGDAFECTWEDRWGRLHELRKIRNVMAHEGGLLKNESEKEIYEKIERREIPGFWLEPFFEWLPDSSKIIVVGEVKFSSLIYELEKLVLDVDGAIFAAGRA